MEKIILAFCKDNAELVTQMDSKLSRIGISFEQITDHDGSLAGQFVAQIQATSAPVLLFITDNFLKSASCMTGALSMLQNLLRTNRVLPIIADGRAKNLETGQFDVVETHFERVIHAITYMNFWQSVYLELRTRKDQVPPAEAESMTSEIKAVRDISNEIGEFLNTLRNAEFFHWKDFSAQDFALFFKKFGIQEFHEQYRKLAAFDEPTTNGFHAGIPAFSEIMRPDENFKTNRKTENFIEKQTDFIEKEVAATVAAAENLTENRVAESSSGPVEIPISMAKNEPSPIQKEAENDAFFPTAEPPVFEKIEAEMAPDFYENKAAEPSVLQQPEPTDLEKMEAEMAPDFYEKEVVEPSDSEAKPPAERSVFQKMEAAVLSVFHKKEAAEPPISEKKEVPILENDDLVARDLEAVAREVAAQAAAQNGHFHKGPNAGFTTEIPTRQSDLDNSQSPISTQQSKISDSQSPFSTNLVDEIVAEEPEIRLAAALQPENLDAEIESAQPPNFPTETDELTDLLGSPTDVLPNEDLDFEKSDARPVFPMQLPHFQPVASASEAEEEFQITVRDARFWLEKGKFDEARRQAEELLVKFPARAEGYFLLGEVDEATGDFAAAKRNWEKTLVLDDDFRGAHGRLARLLDERFKGMKKQAALHFRAAAKENEGDAEATYRAATIYFEHLGKPEKAARFFEKTIERQPEHAAAWYDLAHLHRQMGDWAKAKAFYKRAIELEPSLENEVENRLFELAAAHSEESYFDTQAVENEEVASDLAIEPTVKIEAPKPQILTVLITGATSGIGRATAQIFSENGHRVILTGRRAERLDDLKTRFETDFKNEVWTLNFDVRNLESVKNALAELPENWRDIDLLINNAGLAAGLDFIHEGQFEHWETMIDTNLKGLLYMTRLVAPRMVERKKGHIINLVSTAGKEIYPKGNVYCATKFAVDALTRAMRLDLVAHNIKVSSVSPGHVEETEFALVRFDGDAEKARIYDDFQPLLARDVAETLFFIATRPAHVQIHDVVLTGAQQASATVINRSGRNF